MNMNIDRTIRENIVDGLKEIKNEIELLITNVQLDANTLTMSKVNNISYIMYSITCDIETISDDLL